ncbi:hypothetical protein C9374_002619 [Naegleria lovaniensis]|uniref:Uncharacterized protein n=1 Tax=Naegleria lovaniensis TaxID=51637 RepID=A0AA88GUC4_NAELO|nr:uncharacterized protein C9374_002619 [Naegleria lovaniensis]KAG2386173.1 hypothetical protein C9374_002619 [Naegleria lovaniensis]
MEENNNSFMKTSSTIHDETKKRWYDYIHSNHICSCIFLLFSLVSIVFIIAFLVPMWQFAPISTECTLLAKYMNASFIGSDEKATFRKFRTEFTVSYSASTGGSSNGNQQIVSTLYGPSAESWWNTREAGYVLSSAIRNEFYHSYRVGQKFECFYSGSDVNAVVLEYDPRLNGLIAIPVMLIVLSLWICIHPEIEKYIRSKYQQRESLKQYMELSQMEETYGKEMAEKVATDLFFDDTVGAYRRIGTGEIVQPAAETDHLDGDDEYELIEEEIEVIGKFFGQNIEEQGRFITKSEYMEREAEQNEEKNIKIVSSSSVEEETKQEDSNGASQEVTATPKPPQHTLLVLDSDSEDDDDYDE